MMSGCTGGTGCRGDTSYTGCTGRYSLYSLYSFCTICTWQGCFSVQRKMQGPGRLQSTDYTPQYCHNPEVFDLKQRLLRSQGSNVNNDVMQSITRRTLCIAGGCFEEDFCCRRSHKQVLTSQDSHKDWRQSLSENMMLWTWNHLQPLMNILASPADLAINGCRW